MIGGPAFPDFEQRSWERHNAYRRSVDSPCDPCQGAEPLSGRWFWCGPVTDDFSHQMAEFMHRLPLDSAVPGGLLFAGSPAAGGGQLDTLPVFVRDAIAYLGAAGRRVHVVSLPVLVEELVVLQQGAQLGGSPLPGYLTELSRIQAASSAGGYCAPGSRIYLSRAGLSRGRFLGERYVETLLAMQNVSVVRPEQIPLPQLLRLVAGASLILASEGGVLHGLELLGFYAAPTTVIARRSRTSVGHLDCMRPVRARARNGYHVIDAVDDWVTVGPAEDASSDPNGVAFLDASRLMDGFREVGLDLAATQFDVRSFVRSAQEEFQTYIESFYSRLVSVQDGYQERVIAATDALSAWRSRQLG